ncbi:MAG: ATP-dependent helicase [Acidimicrobiia bacterium]|nr:ATP-dependent helicase [Acidimicrobiia bacterium]MYC57850.1 ATP-dependent helicase [Acidimicrobiia bacterium]MYI30219.1 ATP-dependent helicase [Acidimicrobiia bacterium]
MTDAKKLLDTLNESQQQAVSTPNTPLCIQAGAGTGKTRVLTRRIAFQAQQGNIDPKHTLALTFTRKAANEMRHRLTKLGMQQQVSVGTFHSAAYSQLLTRWAEQRKRPRKLLRDKQGLMARAAKDAGLRLSKPEIQDTVAELEWAKARRVSPQQYPMMIVSLGRSAPMEPGLLSSLFESYEAEKAKRLVLDFDDLLILALLDLAENPDYAEARRWQFQHLFVDELQDVNRLQFDLLRAWLGERSDLCAVGDPNQAIYGWNGADSAYIERFQDWFANATVLKLEENYRSTPQILTAGRAVLGPGAQPLKAHCPDGPIPTVFSHTNDGDEALEIARALRDAKGPETVWRSMAVLARTNAQTATLGAALDRAQIPYQVRTETSRTTTSTPTHDAVAVSTFHAAKGLEWPIVHLAGMEQGFVPIAQAQTPRELAEERRLLYVAITRAQQVLHCHWASERRFGDRTVPRLPSPHLYAISQATKSRYKSKGINTTTTVASHSRNTSST